MKSTKLWIADPEVSYAKALQEFVNLKQSHLFQASVCTDQEQLKALFTEKKSGILLLSVKWKEKGMRIPKGFCVILLSEGDAATGLQKYPILYKYQSIPMLLKEVMYHYSDREVEEGYVAGVRRENKVIGVFSPQGDPDRSLFALTLGQILSKKQNVLYLNMEECSGFREFFGRSQWNISDLIYFLRQNKTQFIYRMNSMLQKLDRMDYIAPCETYTDFRQITVNEWCRMIYHIRTQASYDYLILDMGIVSGHELDLLRQCDGIYVPTRKNAFSDAKMQQWLSHIQILDAVDVESKVFRIELPQIDEYPTQKEELTDLAQQKLGMYIHNLLMEQE